MICVGQCVALSATAAGGTPPYSYAWDHGMPSGSGPVKVYPTVTTTYAVTATDSADRGGEFAMPNNQGASSATVAVTMACSDAGEPLVDASVALGPIPTGVGHALCSLEWPSGGANGNLPYGFGGRLNTADVASDAADDILVVATHTGTAMVGGGSFASGNDTHALVIKMDDQCQIIWENDYGGLLANVLADSIATDTSSNVFVAGALSGYVNFGTGIVGGAAPNTAFLLKLDEGGKALWVKTFATTSSAGSAVDDLAVDPSGNVLRRSDCAPMPRTRPGTFIASGGSDIDFGGGPAGGAASGGTLLVKLGPDGGNIFTKSASAFGPNGPVYLERRATSRTGSIWVTGTAADSAGTTTTPVTEVDPSGALVYSRVIAGPAVASYWNGGTIKVDDANNAAEFTSWGLSADAGVDAGYEGHFRVLSELSPTGNTLWASTAAFLSHFTFSWDGSHFLGMASGGAIYIGSAFQGTIDLGPMLGTLTDAGGADIDVTVIDSNGNLRAAAEWGSGNGDDYPSDMTVDSSGNAIFVGAGYQGTAPSMFVVKLGWATP